MRILFCGLSGIPSKASASINRYMAIAQAMSSENEIIIINRFALFDKVSQQEQERTLFKVLDATGVKYRPKSFFRRNLLKLTSFFYEYRLIKQLNKEKRIDWVNVYSQYFGICLFYFLLSKILGFQIILHYVEYRSKIKDKGFLFKLNGFLFDKYSVYLCQRVIPISNYINSRVKEIRPSLITLIIPPICDFEYFNLIKPQTIENRYFVFCGSAGYSEVIQFILDSFLNITNLNKFELHLIINGDIVNQSIKKQIEDNKDSIKVFSKLKYDELISKYKGSMAQLIPIRDSIQDCARFPQKICEYLASNRPILTTNYGEIPNYFTDGQNAIIASKFEVACYSQKLDWAINNIEAIDAISNNSYSLGIKFFDIHSYRNQINEFLKRDY